MIALKHLPLALALVVSAPALAQTAPTPTVALGQAPAHDESAVVAELTIMAKPPGKRWSRSTPKRPLSSTAAFTSGKPASTSRSSERVHDLRAGGIGWGPAPNPAPPAAAPAR